MKKRNVCLMFSGGYDSTYLLLDIIKQKQESAIDNVFIVMIKSKTILHIEEQYKKSLQILEELGKNFDCVKEFETKTIEINFDCKFVSRFQYGQMAMLLGCSMMTIPDNTEIWFGFSEHETLLGIEKRKEAVENIVKEMANFISYENITVKLPLLDLIDGFGSEKEFECNIKAMIIDKLLYYPEILNLCFSCEGNSYNEKCEECVKHTELRFALDKLLFKYSDYIVNDKIPSGDTLIKIRALIDLYINQFPTFSKLFKFYYDSRNTVDDTDSN